MDGTKTQMNVADTVNRQVLKRALANGVYVFGNTAKESYKEYAEGRYTKTYVVL